MNMEFEKAEITRKKIESLQDYKAKSTIVSSRLGHLDVFTVISEGNHAYINYLRVLNGTIADTKTITLEKNSRKPMKRYCHTQSPISVKLLKALRGKSSCRSRSSIPKRM
ncbi:hypothetical protein MKQ70_29510 [Chitinophaga sedimenti]|nr:hypothetical protein [Chitinophaga sedimenti]MCK7558895.1 hypothetical protein [Chitinophaga sedimenti]